MSEQITLEVQKREATGKGAMRCLRNEGMVPGIFYAKGENVMVQVKQLPLEKAFHKTGTSQLLKLVIGDDKPRPVLVKELRRHAYKRQIQHVDFYGVDLTKTLRIMVPIVTEGEPIGVSEQGGVLTLFRNSVEVECLPTDIPEVITIDVTELELNANIHINEMKMADGVTAIYEENFAVVGVTAKVEEVEEEVEDELLGAETEGEAEAEAEEAEAE